MTVQSLSDDRVREAASNGKVSYLSDGAYGLRLRIQPSGSKSWIQNLTVDGKRVARGLGRYPRTSLAQARKLAEANHRTAQPIKTPTSADVISAAVASAVAPLLEANRAMLANQSAMLAELQALRSTVANLSMATPTALAPPTLHSGVTFETVANAAYDHDSSAWRPVTARSVRSLLDTHVLPALGAMDVGAIEAQDIANAVLPIWARPVGGAMLKRVIRTMDYAKAHGNRATAIDAKTVTPLLPAKRKAETAHRETVGYEALPHGLTRLTGKAADMVRFVAHTACRIGEAADMEWCEIDATAMVWTVPASRTKTHKPHQVPLTSQALALLPTAKRDGKVWDATPMTARRTAKTAKLGTVHGLRSAFRDWCADTGKDRELAELSLGHKFGSDVENAYRRTSLLSLRATLMSDWSEYLQG